MNKTLIRNALFLSVMSVSITAQALTITWEDNLNPLPSFPGALPSPSSPNSLSTDAFSSGKEFRIMGPTGEVASGGGEKSNIDGGEQWIFDDVSGEFIGVVNTDMTLGAVGGASTTGDIGLMKNANFLTQDFGFLAPIVGSAAANLYGVGTISATSGGYEIFFPVLEAQWADFAFPLGLSTGGITFDCDVMGIDVICTAEHIIAASEDSLGFAGQKPQWELHGTISAVPVPAAVWLFGSGLMGLVAVSRRKTNI